MTEGGPHRSRRETLRLLAGGLATSVPLAGCFDVPGIGEPGEAIVGHAMSVFPGDAQFNPWGDNFPWDVYPLCYAYRSVRMAERERELHLLESIDLDGRTATVRYREDFSWWNGDPVTARDDWVAARIERELDERTEAQTSRHVGTALPRSALEPELVDEYTLRYTFPERTDPDLMREVVADGVVSTPSSVFEPWADALEEASDAAYDDVVREFTGTRIDAAELRDGGYGCGPFELAVVAENRLEFVPFDGHPMAEEIEIDRVWLPGVRDDRRDGLFLDGDLDLGQGSLEEFEGVVPDEIELLESYRVDRGYKLLFNWRNPHLENPDVRRAIASILPLEHVASIGGWGVPTDLQTGMSGTAARRTLGEALRSALYEYPIHSDPDRAAAFMESAGYERDDYWIDANGSRPSLSVLGPALEDWSIGLHAVADTLERFGFDVSESYVEWGSFYDRIVAGSYDLSLFYGGGPRFSAYAVTSAWPSGLLYGNVESDAESSQFGRPIEPRLPETVGEFEPGGTFNVIDAWEAVRRGDEAGRRATETFATWWNFALPDLYVADIERSVWGNTRDFAWPAAGDDAYRRSGPAGQPQLYLLKTGRISPR